MKRSGYQENLSLASPILLDRAYKQPKVDKMLAVLRDAGVIGSARRDLAVDVGCSRGFFTEPLAPHFHHVLGMDIDTHALGLARGGDACASAGYLVADSLQMPFADGAVDLVICNHVYEHVPDAGALFAEIHRVLKADGVCYLGAASRLVPVEPHYHLPLLSWLPKPLAHLYMRAAGKGDRYYENLRTYWGLRRLLRGFRVVDYTLKVIADPDRFCARDVIVRGGLMERVPLRVWRALYWLFPTYLLILRKRG